MTLGVGMFIGSTAGRVVDAYATAGGHDWTPIWVIPAAGAFVVLLLFAALFRDPTLRLREAARTASDTAP